MKKDTVKIIRVTQIGSPVGRHFKQGLALKALGLRKINQSVDLPYISDVIGQLKVVHHLIKTQFI